MSNTPEQQARELLDRMGVDGALQMTAGDVVELANLIADRDRLRTLVERQKAMIEDMDRQHIERDGGL